MMIKLRNVSRQLLAVVLLLVAAVSPADERAGEIKAAFIYNFAKFVEWPASSFASGNAPLHVCALDVVTEQTPLPLLDGRVAQGRVIRMVRLQDLSTVDQCHILYVPVTTQASRRVALVEALARRAVLTISEDEAFIDQGGMVSLFVDDDRVRFSVNLKLAQATGLKISARMLQLAQEVR
ncbi:MAG: YfiR family protein [Alcanivoracaceae bacterium]|nr:YfiR family protein [Alcanivoracaceae bacterium]